MRGAHFATLVALICHVHTAGSGPAITLLDLALRAWRRECMARHREEDARAGRVAGGARARGWAYLTVCVATRRRGGPTGILTGHTNLLADCPARSRSPYMGDEIWVVDAAGDEGCELDIGAARARLLVRKKPH